MDLRKVPKSRNVEVDGSFQFRSKREEGLTDKWEALKPGNSWFNRVDLSKRKKK